jgi:hypothetical protein
MTRSPSWPEIDKNAPPGSHRRPLLRFLAHFRLGADSVEGADSRVADQGRDPMVLREICAICEACKVSAVLLDPSGRRAGMVDPDGSWWLRGAWAAGST